MPWNAPNNENPQGEKGSSAPPDLDEILKKMQKKWRTYFGANKSTDGSNEEGPSGSVKGIFVIVALVLGLWFLSGIFIVQPAEQSVVLRFGGYLETVGPGPHWIPQFIESQYKVNEQKIATYYYDAEMLTRDENIVSVAVAVQYRIANARAYLFNVVNPVLSLQQATASALRQVLGNTTLDAVLTSGREKVRGDVQMQLEKILDFYNTGILVTDVSLQPAKAPEEVKAAFDDAIKAQEDEQRYINQAQAYEKNVIPVAQGQAQRLLAAAKAYEQQVVLKARGDTLRFLAILPEYKKAPAVTRERLYLSAMEQVMSRSSKVLVDLDKSNNLVYLPLDKLLSSSATAKELSALSVTESTDGGEKNRGAYSESSPDASSEKDLIARYSSRSMRGESQ